MENDQDKDRTELRSSDINQDLNTCDHYKDLRIMYTNADSVLNKKDELKLLIDAQKKKPHIVAITEAKPKNYSGELLASEFELDGYNVFYNGGKDDSSRGILVYASAEISAAYMEESISFKEYLLIKIKTKNKSNILFGIVYRSPTSSQENDRELFTLISYLNVKFSDHLVLVGDFNYSSIDWQRWTGSGNPMNSDEKFIDVLQKNGLHQHITTPTRQRGDDEPHVLDLVITSDDIVST